MPWADYTARALTRIGHAPVIFHYTDIGVARLTLRKGRQWASSIPGADSALRALREDWHRRRDRRLVRLASRLHPDLILALHGESLSPELLGELRRNSQGPLVTWWMDEPFRYGAERLLPLYDTVFLFDRSYIPQIRALGAKDVRFLPCACDEEVYRPMDLPPGQRKRYGCDVALVGWFYPRRAELIRALSGLDLKVWGKGWRTPEAKTALNGAGHRVVPEERFVTDRETARIYNAAKIGLNVHSRQTREAGLNTRAFELLAAGTFQLTDAVPGMEELLEPGREVAVFRSAEEGRSLADYYLRHPQERAEMAARGRERVLREHTYTHRMQSLLRVVK